MSKRITCSIVFDRPGDPWIQQNLEDLAWSLDKNLRRRGEGEASAKQGPGFAKIEATADRETLGMYVDAFVRRMKRDGHLIEVVYESD